jgi:hypothetical protein
MQSVSKIALIIDKAYSNWAFSIPSSRHGMVCNQNRSKERMFFSSMSSEHFHPCEVLAFPCQS